MKNGPDELLITWETDLRIICHSHYDAAVLASRRNYQLGIPTITLSAIVGTAIFSTIEKSPERALQISAGLLSMLTMVLASLQTFLKWSERAEKHRKAGARFGALLKELENKVAFKPDNKDLEQWSNDFRERWDQISMESPTVPKKLWNRKKSEEKQRQKEKLEE
jgi:hypothetical protein